MIGVFQTFRVLYTLGLHYITLYYITGEIEISNFQHKKSSGYTYTRLNTIVFFFLNNQLTIFFSKGKVQYPGLVNIILVSILNVKVPN